MVLSTRTLDFKEQLVEMGSARNRSLCPFSVVKIQLFLEVHIVCHLTGEAFLHFPSGMCSACLRGSINHTQLQQRWQG